MPRYAFDVIACITFQRRFGFMEEKKDVGGMIEAISAAFPYMATVGQLPALHPWLRGNKKLMKLLKYLRPNQPHPFLDILKVCSYTQMLSCTVNLSVGCLGRRHLEPRFSQKPVLIFSPA